MRSCVQKPMPGDLGVAASRGDFEKVKELVGRGADVNEKYNGMTPLVWAAQDGNPDVVSLLLDHGARVDECDKHGNTPLWRAASAGKAAAAEILIARGADLNAASGQGETPLIIAAKNGCGDAAMLLLARGADPDLLDNANRNAYFWAARRGPELEEVKLSIEHAAAQNRQRRLKKLKKPGLRP